MDNFETTGNALAQRPVLRGLSSTKRLLVAGFALLGIILIAAAAFSAWQAGLERTKSDEAEAHATTVSLLEDVEEEAGIAATLLQTYAADGDDALIPEIQSHSRAALNSLTAAVAQGSASGLDEIAVQGAGLAGGAGEVIALRQSGDAQGATAALEEMAPVFGAFTMSLEEVTDREQREIAALQAEADRAGDVALRFLIVAAVAGGTLGAAALTLIARSLIRRRVAKRAAPI